MVVTDSAGGTAQSSVLVAVNAPPPKPVITAVPASGLAPLPVLFTAVLSPGAPASAYSWNFGDGSSPSNAFAPSHTYLRAGAFLVTLTVTDGAGRTGTATMTVTVTSLTAIIGL